MHASRKGIAAAPIDTAPLADPAERIRLTPAARNAIVAIAEIWGLTDQEAAALFGFSHRTWRRIKSGKFNTFSQDQLTRASLAIGLFKNLETAFSPSISRDWVRSRRDDPNYIGQSPLEIMVKYGIPGMIAVRNHSEAICAAA